MRKFGRIALILCLALGTQAAFANQDEEELNRLFANLQHDGAEDWQQTELAIVNHWSRSGSDALDLLLRRSRQALGAGNAVLAVEHATALIENAPDFAEGWNARATAYFHMGEFVLSLQDIERVLALNPRHFGALSGLGMVMEELGNPQYALEAFEAAHDLNPNRPETQDAIERLETVLGLFEI